MSRKPWLLQWSLVGEYESSEKLWDGWVTDREMGKTRNIVL